jgi:hypothetical protein
LDAADESLVLVKVVDLLELLIHQRILPDRWHPCQPLSIGTYALAEEYSEDGHKRT